MSEELRVKLVYTIFAFSKGNYARTVMVMEYAIITKRKYDSNRQADIFHLRQCKYDWTQ